MNSVEVHPQLSNNRHPVDGALVGAGSLWSKNRYLPALHYSVTDGALPEPKVIV